LKLDQIDNGKPRVACQPVEARVIDLAAVTRRRATRAVAAWLKQRARVKAPAMVKAFFISERRKALHRSTVNALVDKYSAARFPAISRESACAAARLRFALADQGTDTRLIQDYLGYPKIEHTVKYTASNPARFERLWRYVLHPLQAAR